MAPWRHDVTHIPRVSGKIYRPTALLENSMLKITVSIMLILSLKGYATFFEDNFSLDLKDL